MNFETKKIILHKRPSGELTEECFHTTGETLHKCGRNEIRVKILYLSVDPYMRNRMNDVRSYVPPFIVGEAIEGDGIAVVVDSEYAQLKSGDLVVGVLPWQQFALLQGDRVRKIDTDPHIPVTSYLGVLGLTGLTAYFGMLDIGEPQSGETVVVSGAAGAVGSVAGQIARIKGCRVIGIVGSDKKEEFILRECAFDGSINYRNFRNIRKPLRELCTSGIDIYFDNVGGDISDAVLYQLNDFARIVLSGQISQYNQNRLAMGPRLTALLIIHRVKMQGFIVHDYKDDFAQALSQLKRWLGKGEIVNREHIIEGFDNLPHALISLFHGENTGKMIVRI